MAERYLKTQWHLILASQSPRRKELLENLGIRFSCVTPNILEARQAKESPAKYVKRNSFEKAYKVLQTHHEKNTIILSADTVVVINKKVLEKPNDTKDAQEMLQLLSGKTHQVLTGVTILSYRKAIDCHQFVTSTSVTFRKLLSSEIKKYVKTKEPMDKAGAYAAQGKGAFMVESVNGSYTNVIGLPMSEVSKILIKDFKLEIFPKNKL